jgi:hypothetical protein
MAQNILGRGGSRKHSDPAAMRGQHSQDVALGSVIDSDDAMARIALLAVTELAIPHCLVPFVGLTAGNFLGEIHPLETRPIDGLRLEGRDIDSPSRIVRDCAVWRPEIANPSGQPTGVYSGNADLPIGFQPAIERLGGAVICGGGDRTAEDEPARGWSCGFDVLSVRSDIPDMGERKSNDLAGVGGVSEDFLISGDRSVEANLANSLSVRAEALAPKYRPVRENKRSVAVGRSRHQIANQWKSFGRPHLPEPHGAAGGEYHGF